MEGRRRKGGGGKEEERSRRMRRSKGGLTGIELEMAINFFTTHHVGRLSDDILWVSCVLARFAIISPEFHHNFTRHSSDFH